MPLFDKPGFTVLRPASLALTTSLVASDALTTTRASYVTVETLYAVGSGGTGVELVPEVSMDEGATWSPASTAPRLRLWWIQVCAGGPRQRASLRSSAPSIRPFGAAASALPRERP